MYKGQRGVTGDKRVVNLTRSAYAGQQRYGTIAWSGDIVATWETLRNQIPAGLNFCVTGLPYWTLDIGAFFVKNKPELWFWSGDYDEGAQDPGYRELFVRWFQYGAFLPMFRTHGTDTPREIWRFGNPGELMYDTLVKYLRLRYRLLPYIYSLAGLVTQQDYTLMRALPFYFRQVSVRCTRMPHGSVKCGRPYSLALGVLRGVLQLLAATLDILADALHRVTACQCA
jgi:alpha-D-xyloside xylohydrolase